ncbi:MAG: TrkA family potassium uptake protein [Methanobacterium sp.]|uniref:potassium channel family protein n=1 Tax=Methanobacterium sp. TaxID=2164 RepID=UPI003C72DAF0
MYVVIMGGGDLGLHVALDLVKDSNDVTIIEDDENRCKLLATKLDTTVICGSGTDRKTLENAEISEADVFVAATGNDNTNLLASLMAKEYNPKKIIARVNEPQHESVFTENNLIDVIVPESIEAGYLERLVLRPKIADLFVVDHGHADLLDLYVTNSKMIGKKISELYPNDDYFICGYHEDDDDNISIATPDMVLKENCRISMLVKTESMAKVLKIFTK